MRNAASTHWRAAAWLLERTNPQQFDRRRGPGCKPQELHDVVDAVIESAAEEVADPDLRDRLCRRLMAVANRAARKLDLGPAFASRSRRSFDLPTSAEQRSLDKLLAEIDRSRASAFRDLKRQSAKPVEMCVTSMTRRPDYLRLAAGRRPRKIQEFCNC